MSKLITSSSHGRGHTCLAFSKDGARVFTGGQDCIVRIWNVNEGAENEPDTAAEAEGAVTWVATADDCWLSSSEDTEVRRYSKDSVSFDAPLTSAAGVAVRCVAIDPKGRRVAVASDELFVKVVDMEDILKVNRLEGYTSPVRSVTWHPSGNLITTCSCDGKIMIWDMSVDQPRLEKTIEGLIPVVIDQESPEFSYDCSIVWHTSGEYFYVASKGHEIVTISRSNWAKMPGSTFTDKNVMGAVTAMTLSPNGVYLITAIQSWVHIWSTQTRRVVTSHIGNPGSTVTQIAFSPRQNLIAWTDSEGVFTRWPKPIPDTLPDPTKQSIVTNSSATTQVKPKGSINLFGDGGDDALNALGDDPFEVDLDEAMLDDNWIVDDMDGALNDEPEVTKISNGFVKEMVSITKAQPPFQPGSTPMEHRKRYLAYNMLGVIEVTDQDTHHIVTVELFDRSMRKGYHFTDHFKYDLGYIGERGTVFACQPENDHPAQVLFRPFSSENSQKEWTYPLKRTNIRVLGVAVGGLPPVRNAGDSDLEGLGNVVVATTESDLTFLSGTGRERRIMALGGDFVSMVASAEWVFVVHRAGSTTIDGSQNLSYTIVNFEDFSVRQRDILPVPKGHTLKWIGITDQGAPAMYDSTGWVHVLTKYRIPHHASWARVMDTNLLERRQGKDESYWPIGITGSNFMCLILKGRQEHPGFPRPLIQELPVRMPFRREEAREEQVERELLLMQIALDSLDDELTTDDIVTRERAVDKEFIMLIQAACKADNIPRAIELTKLLHHLTSFDAAMKIAEFYHLIGFKEKVEMLKNEREEGEERAVLARNKRKRWLKPDPPARQIVALNGVSSSSRYDPLSDVRPPPTIERPGMARVTVPIIEKTRYTSVAPASQTLERTIANDVSSFTQSPTPLDKRKRTEIEDSFPGSDLSMPPPKQKANPFARKPGQESTRNPFARRVESKTILKSESFFEKVDAVESENPVRKRPAANVKGKEKEKKDGPRQATLFSMMPSKSNKPMVKNKAEEHASPLEPDSQADITMSDALAPSDAGTLVETQIDSQQSLADDWEETQIVEEGTLSSSISEDLN